MVNLAYFICGQAGLVPLATGIPGVAKTASLLALAKALGFKLYILTGSIREPADIGGYPTLVEVVHDGRTVQYMKIVPPEYVVKAMSEPTILFIDELTCCHPGTQSAMLAIAAERRVGDTYLPDSTLIFAACNPPGTAANGFPLEATMANRLVHLKWQFPRKEWLKGLRNGLNYPEPNPPIIDKNWKDHITGISTLVAEFHEREPGHLVPEEDDNGELRLSSKERSGAYPTPRTWDMAVRGIAALKSIEDQVDEPRVVEEDIVRGCVGYGAAEAYYEYVDNLDLPDPEEVIKSMVRVQASITSDDDDLLQSIVPDPKRADKVRAFIGSVCSSIIVENSEQRWEAAEEIVRQTAKRHKEVAVVSAGPLYRNIPKKCEISDDMVELVWDTLGFTLNTKGT